MSEEHFVDAIDETCARLTTEQCHTTLLYNIPIASLAIDNKERLCLAQISNTLLKKYSYNEIHNRRVALGITCVQCTPVQLEILRRAGAMPISSRRCGMITKHEAERLVKSFLEETTPVKLPDNFAFEVEHTCSWGCQGSFIPSRYNSSRAKCIKCTFCGIYLSPNKFIFHSHRLPESKYQHPDAANFNSWRRHINLANTDSSDELLHAWEDVKAMFNGGSRKRSLLTCSKTSVTNSIPVISLAPSSKRMQFDMTSTHSSIRTPVYPFVASPFFPKPFQNVGHEALIPFIPPHRMGMESVSGADYSPSFPMSSWKMAPFWLNSKMIGGSFLETMASGGHDTTWQELHGTALRPHSSNGDLGIPTVSKMLKPNHVSAFTPVEHRRSIGELEDQLRKISCPNRHESTKRRRSYASDKFTTAATSDSIHDFGFEVRMNASPADRVNMTQCLDTFEEKQGLAFGLPIRSRYKSASNAQPDSALQQEHDIKQLTRSELEAKLAEAQSTLSNLTSSSNTSSTSVEK
ncbi:uncharacterized protein LOC117110778 [Anneissia japonica]|uniref:uncharacterized protein LOC117110778 n=1 Tax=Anneissia japonica TaxID=1529436 RepID=UPI0014256F78|nr:uncharacterized protein LOC117110778 [Anneissia japonica]